jgi:hypothetical protein
MRRSRRVNSLSEYNPLLLELGTSPPIPSCVNQLVPPDVVFLVKVQLRDPR